MCALLYGAGARFSIAFQMQTFTQRNRRQLQWTLSGGYVLTALPAFEPMATGLHALVCGLVGSSPHSVTCTSPQGTDSVTEGTKQHMLTGAEGRQLSVNWLRD